MCLNYVFEEPLYLMVADLHASISFGQLSLQQQATASIWLSCEYGHVMLLSAMA